MVNKRRTQNQRAIELAAEYAALASDHFQCGYFTFPSATSTSIHYTSGPMCRDYEVYACLSQVWAEIDKRLNP